MPDTYSSETRSRVMRQIKSSDTSTELILRKALYASGLRGWRCHRTDLPGKPDLVFNRVKVAVFVDGAFWHGHPKKFRPGQSGEYWDKKIARNIERDKLATAALRESGWIVIRIWDFDIAKEPHAAVQLVVQTVEQARTAK
ncbi:MAG: very short patch repair endonuclease [Actinomycetota bacterium]|nr:very short patch repair endonuclease [Actinomycetota bacterium]